VRYSNSSRRLKTKVIPSFSCEIFINPPKNATARAAARFRCQLLRIKHGTVHESR